MAKEIVTPESMALESELYTLKEGTLRHPETTLGHDLSQLFQMLIISLERDAYDIQLSTTQKIRLERIATIYIKTRELEATSGFSKPAEQKDYNLFLNALMVEHEKSLRQSREDARDEQLEKIKRVMISVINELPDAKMKNALKGKFIQGIEDEGL